MLAVFWLCLGPLNWPQDLAVTVSFLSLAFGRLWHVFNMRDRNSSLFRNEIVQNPYVWGALLICTGLLLTSVYLPGLAGRAASRASRCRGLGVNFGGERVTALLSDKSRSSFRKLDFSDG